MIPLLNTLPFLSKNPYWLVKVKLLELLSDIPYINIQFVTTNRNFQNNIVHNVLFELLKNEDQRVRTATSNAICKIIPNLYFDQGNSKETIVISKAVQYKDKYLSNLSNIIFEVNNNRKNFVDNMPFPYSAIHDDGSETVENSLSRIVVKLYEYLLTGTSKHLIVSTA